MLSFTHNRTVVRFGDNLADVQRWLEATPRTWSIDYSTIQRRRDFDMGCDWETTLRYAREGWTQGALDLATDLELMAPPVNRHADLKYDVGGYLPDVPRFLSGNPAHMVTKGRRIGSPPVVHLLMNLWCSAATNASAMREYGAALAACVDKLEAKDHRVELDVVFVGNLRGYRYVIGWKVKQASEHCDLAVIAFSLAHPCAFRRIGFAMLERTLASMSDPGYGHVETMTDEDKRLINAEQAMLLGGIGESYYRGQRDMLKLVAEQINKAAGETLVEVEG